MNEDVKDAIRLLLRFSDGPPGRSGFTPTDGWASEDFRYCGYCSAKSAWSAKDLAHYDDCVFIAARAWLLRMSKAPL